MTFRAIVEKKIYLFLVRISDFQMLFLKSPQIGSFLPFFSTQAFWKNRRSRAELFAQKSEPSLGSDPSLIYIYIAKWLGIICATGKSVSGRTFSFKLPKHQEEVKIWVQYLHTQKDISKRPIAILWLQVEKQFKFAHRMQI